MYIVPRVSRTLKVLEIKTRAQERLGGTGETRIGINGRTLSSPVAGSDEL